MAATVAATDITATAAAAAITTTFGSGLTGHFLTTKALNGKMSILLEAKSHRTNIRTKLIL